MFINYLIPVDPNPPEPRSVFSKFVTSFNFAFTMGIKPFVLSVILFQQQKLYHLNLLILL